MTPCRAGALVRRRFGPASLAAVVLIVTACTAAGSSDPSAASSQSPAPATLVAPSAAASEAPSSGGGRGDYNYGDGTAASAPSSGSEPRTLLVAIANGPLRAYLTGDNGLTLYTFKPDSANTSTCTGGCAQAWPPFTIGADDTLEGGDGVGGALTTFARTDGTLQVAYNGAPLYSFANDTSPGDTNGQGIGSNWFVAKP